MPFGYHINSDEGLITITGDGIVMPDEARQVLSELHEDGHYDQSLPHLIDLRMLAIAQHDPVELKKLERFLLTEYRPKVSASVAVVVDGTLDRFSLAAIFHLVCRAPQTELFDYFDHALRWLIKHEFANPIRHLD